MRTRFRHVALALASAAMAAGLCAQPAAAAEVVVQMKGGGFSVTGELLSFDGKAYAIDSKALGKISLDASRFECISEGCPGGGVPAPAAAAAAAEAAPAASGNAASEGRLVSQAEGFSIHGSNTIGAKLMPALIKAYAASIQASMKTVVGSDPKQVMFQVSDSSGAPLFKIDLQRYGSATAFTALAGGAADLGMSDRPIDDKDIALLEAAGFSNMRAAERENVFGLDGIVVVVSPQNSAIALSLDNIADIFSGVVNDWSQLGLPAGPITVIAPDDKQGTFGTFNSLLLKPRKLAIRKDAQRFTSNAEISDLVAATPGAIGLTSFSAKRNSKLLNIQNSCGLVMKPSVFSVKAEEYVLSRRLYIYTTGQLAHPHARAFLEFIKSPAGQAVVSENDFTEQSVDSLSFQEQGGRIAYALNAPAEDFNMQLMREMIGDLTNGKRLSTTIRFLTGSFDIDSRGRDDINRLVTVLRSEDLKGKELMLLGFADSTGDFSANTLLAQRRAMRVLKEVSDASGGTINATVIVAKSYSELAPVACNQEANGRDLNRRVEVWVRDHNSAPKLAGLQPTGGLKQKPVAKVEDAAKPVDAEPVAVSEDGTTAAKPKPKAVVKKKKQADAPAEDAQEAPPTQSGSSLLDLFSGSTAN